MDKEKFSIKAVLIGWLVDIIGTTVSIFIVSIIIGFIIGITLARNKPTLSPDEIAAAVEQLFFRSGLRILFLAIGSFFTALGGYVTARIAKNSELKHALVMGIVSLITGISLVLMLRTPLKDWIDWSSFVVTIPFALLGGYICIKTKK